MTVLAWSDAAHVPGGPSPEDVGRAAVGVVVWPDDDDPTYSGHFLNETSTAAAELAGLVVAIEQASARARSEEPILAFCDRQDAVMWVNRLLFRDISPRPEWRRAVEDHELLPPTLVPHEVKPGVVDLDRRSRLQVFAVLQRLCTIAAGRPLAVTWALPGPALDLCDAVARRTLGCSKNQGRMNVEHQVQRLVQAICEQRLRVHLGDVLRANARTDR